MVNSCEVKDVWYFPKSKRVVVEWKFACSTHSEANKAKHLSLEQRKIYCRALQGDGFLVPNKTPNSWMGSSKALLKARRWRAVVSCCRLLGLGIKKTKTDFVLAAVHIGQITIFLLNVQQDKYYSLFCNFLYLYEWTLKGPSREKRLFYIFQGIGNRVLQRFRASMTKLGKRNRPNMESDLFFPVTELQRTICPVAQWANIPVPHCGT